MDDHYSSVIITGTIAYDEIMDFPGKFIDHFHPERLHQINISFVVSKLEKQLGGTATNISYNLSLANAYLKNTVPIIPLSAVGKDGKTFLDFFEKNHIVTDGIIVDRTQYTATGKVITDRNDNQIWGYYYGASKSAATIHTKKFNSPKSLWMISANHKDAFMHFQKEAIRNNNTYIYDPGMSLTWISDENLREGVMHAQYLVGNDYEIAMILKRLHVSINQLIETGIQVITTLGEKGVRFETKYTNRQMTNKQMNDKLENKKITKIYVPAYKVKTVVDPTGAGDAWRGGFIAGLVKGLPIKDCLKLGNVMASFAIEKYGTVNHKPKEKEIEKRLKSL